MNETRQNAIITGAQSFARLTSGIQHDYYEQMLKDFREVKLSRVRDVFTDDEIKRIIFYVSPEKKMCYKNSHLLTSLFPERVKYIEGQMTIFGGGWGIDHAWNLVDGKHYVDLTMEFALGEDPTKETYMALGEYDYSKITRIAARTGFYGNIYNEIFFENNKSKLKQKHYENKD